MVVLSQIEQNVVPNEPELADLLNLFRKDLLLQFNCHHLGTVQSFNAATQTAKVTINYRRTYFKPNAMGVVSPETRAYPVIADAPVVVMGGGGYSLTFPVAAGDECIVMFNDRDIDAWFAGSSNSPNPTPRLHDFADAMVLVGVRSLKSVVIGYDTDGVALRDKLGLTKLKLTSAGKFSVTNAPGVELIAALFEMLNAITSATAGGYPLLLPTTYAAELAKLQSFKV